MFTAKKIHPMQWIWLLLFASFYIFLFYIIKTNTPAASQNNLHELTQFSLQDKPLWPWTVWLCVFSLGSLLASYLGIKASRKKSKKILEKLEKLAIESSNTQFGSPLKLPLYALPTHQFFIERLNKFIEWKDRVKGQLITDLKDLKKEVDTELEGSKPAFKNQSEI